MAAPVTSNSVMSAISVAPKSPVNSSASVQSGAFQGELKQATQVENRAKSETKKTADNAPVADKNTTKSNVKSDELVDNGGRVQSAKDSRKATAETQGRSQESVKDIAKQVSGENSAIAPSADDELLTSTEGTLLPSAAQVLPPFPVTAQTVVPDSLAPDTSTAVVGTPKEEGAQLPVSAAVVTSTESMALADTIESEVKGPKVAVVESKSVDVVPSLPSASAVKADTAIVTPAPLIDQASALPGSAPAADPTLVEKASQSPAVPIPSTAPVSNTVAVAADSPVSTPAQVTISDEKVVSVSQQRADVGSSVPVPSPLNGKDLNNPAPAVHLQNESVMPSESAISAKDTNVALQNNAAQQHKDVSVGVPSSIPVVAEESLETAKTQAPVVSAQSQQASPVQPVPVKAELGVKADAAAVLAQEVTAVSKGESVVNAPVTPLQLAVASAVKAEPTAAAVSPLQNVRQSDADPLLKAIKGDVSSQSKEKQGVEPTLSLAAAPAPVMGQKVINPSITPTEFLNTNLQQLRAGIDISASVTPERTEVSDNVSTKASAPESIQQLNGLQNNLRTTSPVQLQLPIGTPPGSQNWSKAVADKVMIAASQNLRVANIHLDPPELGALQVRLQVGADQQVNISFTSPAGTVRDALEQQMPRLREMLEEQGINLGESDVKDQNDSERDSQTAQADVGGDYAVGDEAELEQQGALLQRNLALVDYYA